ncbi:MAG: hypothetical protein RLY58_1158 [Pseudomonadota bacterium]
MIRRLPRWILYGSVLLAFSAGCVNCIALLGFANTAVSHVTGTVSNTASALVRHNVPVFSLGFGIVAAFLVGAMLSGVIVKNEALRLGRHYGLALLLESLLLFAATWFFMRQHVAGELLASAACGLQNAMIATYSGSVIRTTHLTGILSDIGSALGSRLAGRAVQWMSFRLQVSILLAFFVGGVVGAALFLHVGSLALLLPATVVLLAALGYAAVELWGGHDTHELRE